MMVGDGSFSGLQFRIAGITKESIVDGPGLRHTIFVQGCRHACPGCHNPDTWDLSGGEVVGWTELLNRVPLNPLITGITFSGGEPFLQAEPLSKLAAYFKEKGLDIWVYTGFTWEDLLSGENHSGYLELLQQTDVLVDGPFLKEKRALHLPFRGSDNQRLIRVGPSLSSGAIIPWNPEMVFDKK